MDNRVAVSNWYSNGQSVYCSDSILSNRDRSKIENTDATRHVARFFRLDTIRNIRDYRQEFPPLYNINYLSTTLNILRKHKLYSCLREIHLVKVTQEAIQRELLLFASFTSNFHQRDLFPRGKRWFAWYFVAVYINAVVLNRYASRKLCLFSGYLFDRNIAKTWWIYACILYTETCITNADTSQRRLVEEVKD